MANGNTTGGYGAAAEEVIARLLSRGDVDQRKLIEALEKAGVSTDGVTAAMRANTNASRDLNRGLGGLFGGTGSRFGQLAGELEGLGGAAGQAGSKWGKFTSFISQGFSLAKAGYDRAMLLSDKVYEAFGTGVVFEGGMAEYNKAFADLGIDINTFSAIVNKGSLAVATLGTKRFVELGKVLKEQTDRGAALGYFEAEMYETFTSYTEQLRRTGELQGMTNEQLIEDTKAYMVELNAVAQATGKRKEQIDAELKQQKVSGGYFATMAKLPDEMRKAMLDPKTLAQFQQFGAAQNEVMEAVAQYVNRGNSIAGIQDKAFRYIFQQSAAAGESFEGYVRALQAGDTAAADAQMKLFKDSLMELMERQAPGTAYGAGISENAQLMGRLFQEMVTRQETRPGGQPGVIPPDAEKFRSTAAAMSDAFQQANKAMNTMAVGLTDQLLPAMKKTAEGVVYASQQFDLALQTLGLMDANGRMTGEGMAVAASAAITAIVGTAAVGVITADVIRKMATGQMPARMEPGASARFLRSFLAGGMGISAGIETLEQGGTPGEAAMVGGGTLGGAYLGGQAGLRLGAMTRSQFITLIAGLAGALGGGVVGREAVESYLGINNGGIAAREPGYAGQPLTQSQREVVDQLSAGVEAALRNDQRQTNMNESMMNKLQELIDAITAQTRELSSTITRQGGNARP